MLGLSYGPARAAHARISRRADAVVAREALSYEGELYRVGGLALTVPGAQPVPTVVAALGPLMLRLTASWRTAPILGWWGRRPMEQHIVARLSAAAAAAGRPAPRVVGGVPIVLTNKAGCGAREKIAGALTMYGQLPSYRAMLDREGVGRPCRHRARRR